MKNEFTAIFERDGGCYIAYYPEIPGANDQEKTKEDTPGRLLHSFRQDEGRAREERRSATVARRALQRQRGLRPEAGTRGANSHRRKIPAAGGRGTNNLCGEKNWRGGDERAVIIRKIFTF
jgi:hypothetical protein